LRRYEKITGMTSQIHILPPSTPAIGRWEAVLSIVRGRWASSSASSSYRGPRLFRPLGQGGISKRVLTGWFRHTKFPPAVTLSNFSTSNHPAPRKCPGRSYPHSSTSVAKATKSKGKNLKVVPLHLYMTWRIYGGISVYLHIHRVHLCIYIYTPYVSICVAWYHSLLSLNATVGSNKNDTFEFSFVPLSHHHRQSFPTKRPPIH